MPYWCPDCRSYFSVRTGTAIARSKIPLRKWAIAIYLEMTSLKGVSSMKLHRDLGISQKSAWFMLHRIREAWSWDARKDAFLGPVEADETYFGGKRKNMSNAKRKELADTGRGPVGKTAVVGVKDRPSGKVTARPTTDTARPTTDTTSPTLTGMVTDTTLAGSTVFTDGDRSYDPLKEMGFLHAKVMHSVGEYVRGPASTNGIENYWSHLKRTYVGTYHYWSPEHLDRYVTEYSFRYNRRKSHVTDRMAEAVELMEGRSLSWRELTAVGPSAKLVNLGCVR
ncbi:MAG: IS1595 family transposase [Gemmatimonadetes bacterium]|nr:IS1595 family transposase [Gemmatimonadota bacterium]